MTDFVAIAAGLVPAWIVRRDARHVAFLAERPVRPGHVIVATTASVDSVFDLDADAAAALWAFVHDLGRELRRELRCARVCVSVIGWVVRHAHVHLVPTDAPDQVPGLVGAAADPAELAALCARLSR